jgi:predicted transcriptional regulator
MRKKGISQMPVINGKDIVGLLTEKEVVMNAGKDMKKIKVADIMQDMPPKISKFTSIDTVKELLLEFSAVIVMDAGKAVGIITKSNLLK